GRLIFRGTGCDIGRIRGRVYRRALTMRGRRCELPLAATAVKRSCPLPCVDAHDRRSGTAFNRRSYESDVKRGVACFVRPNGPVYRWSGLDTLSGVTCAGFDVVRLKPLAACVATTAAARHNAARGPL